MRMIRVASLTAVLALTGGVGHPYPAGAQTRDVVYYYAMTPTGKPTPRPYPGCKRVQVKSKSLWACPSSASNALPDWLGGLVGNLSGGSRGQGDFGMGSGRSGGGMGGSQGRGS